MLQAIYHLYRWTTAVKFWFTRRILPAGWGMGIASVIAATMLMGSPITPLYQMFALLFGLNSVALLWVWSRRAKLHARRELPRTQPWANTCVIPSRSTMKAAPCATGACKRPPPIPALPGIHFSSRASPARRYAIASTGFLPSIAGSGC